MFALLVATLASFQSAIPAQPYVLGQTAWIFSTIGHSEFCPAGNVRLDLTTGVYSLTPRAARSKCDDLSLERPATTGRLALDRLSSIQMAFVRVFNEGGEIPECREGEKPETIIINNGGTPIMVLMIGAGAMSAPEKLSCWSKALTDLHDQVDKAFASNHER
jgi:hypothetical protein